MFQRLFAWMNRHERRLSGAAMAAGFTIDQIFFGRVDLWQTQAVFASYVVICFLSIALLHALEARAERGAAQPRWRPLLPFATQFALGGFWSGFIVFYGRSAVWGASWPFLLFLALVFLGNEVFKRYHDRLVFTSVLFFFALYSYAIFALPVYLSAIGTGVFLGSGLVAIAAFGLFTILLRILGHARFRASVWRIRTGALLVLLLVNIFYFTNILPPLPLAAKSAGIYHAVEKSGDVYIAFAEPHSWYAAPWRAVFGQVPTLSVVPGASLYAYSAVFAPVALSTTIVHEWQRYDATGKQWITTSAISFPIAGGRDGGYRGYSVKAALTAGEWRVNVKTADGRLIARVPFFVKLVSLPPPQEEISLP
ncbi:DUF2914 domain-containing protein [Candidatus Kaiserbacteria bacterium]|nr:DUF2914 domain-containing protein [Candidatus Kaiserbacteria bacterium]